MDQVCMYEWFAKFKLKFNKTTGAQEIVMKKRPAIVVPTPSLRASWDNDLWCYQMLMMFTPFRNHDEVMYHPDDRDLTRVVVVDYVDDQISDPAAVPPEPDEAPPDRVRTDSEDTPEDEVLVEEVVCDALDTTLGDSAVGNCTQRHPTLQEFLGITVPYQTRVGEEEEEMISVPIAHACEPTVTQVDADQNLTQPHPTLAELFDVPELDHRDTVTPPPDKATPTREVEIARAQCTAVPYQTRVGEEEEEMESVAVADAPVPSSQPAETQPLERSDDAPRARYPKPYKSARQLLLLLLKTGRISKSFTNTCSNLELLQGFMTQALADQNTIPTESEVMAHLQSLLGDESNGICIDELMQRVSLEQTLKSNRNVVKADDPSRHFYFGTAHQAAIAQLKKDGRQVLKEDASRKPNPLGNRPSTPAELEAAIRQYRESIDKCTGRYKNLRLRQKLVLLMVIDTIEDLVTEKHVRENREMRTCRLILQGEAGTGKTYVLKEVVNLLCFFLSPFAVRVFAPTAHAAKTYQDCPCGATTFHKMWQKTWGGSEDMYGGSGLTPSLTGAANDRFTVTMKDVRALICDEISMISPSDVELMSRRVCDCMGEPKNPSKTPFHGMPIVIMCGDLYQLPPVKAFPLYHHEFDLEGERQHLTAAASKTTVRSKKRTVAQLPDAQAPQARVLTEAEIEQKLVSKIYHNKGVQLYHEFFDKCIILNENVRQDGDPRYRYILKRVRHGIATRNDCTTLNTRQFDQFFYSDACEDAQSFKTCKRFFPTNNATLVQSEKMFTDMFPNLEHTFDASPIITMNGQYCQYEDIVRYGGEVAKTAYRLRLAVGAPVILTSNLDGARDWGIVNGSTGTVEGYITLNGVIPDYVLFKPDAALEGMPTLSLTVAGSNEKMVFKNTWPIPMVYKKYERTDRVTKQKVYFGIRHFPLQLAYALTIHKAQGMTEDFAVIDIVQAGSTGGGQLPYVALSRVRSLQGLLLVQKLDLNSDLNKFAKSKDRDDLLAEFDRMEQIQRRCIVAMGYEEEDRIKSEELDALEKRLMEQD